MCTPCHLVFTHSPNPQAAAEENLKRQAPDVQSPSKSDGGAVVSYPKRQAPDVQSPSKSDGNGVVAYPKRQAPDVQSPSKSDGNGVVAYPKRSQTPSIPCHVAVRSVNGVVELYE